MTPCRLSGPIAIAVCLLAAPAASHAASVDITSNVLHYTGGAEDNLLSLTFAGGQYTATDGVGVTITPGSGCSNPEGDNTATCSGTVNRLEWAGGAGFDRLDASDPSLPVFSGISEYDGGDDDDVILGSRGPDNLRGGAGDDYLIGGPSSDWSFGGPGKDVSSYLGAPGPVSVDLAPATINDGAPFEADDVNHDGTVEGAEGGDQGDVLTGTGNSESLTGWDGQDTINGAGGRDVIDGGAQTDTINAGPGDDEVSGGQVPTRDVLDGGTGTDTISYRDHFAPVRVALMGGIEQGAAGEDDALMDFENVRGGEGDDVLTGDGRTNMLFGGGGDDVLDGELGNDWLWGEDGEDEASYETRDVPVTVSLTTGFFPGGGAAGEFDVVLAEDIRGGQEDDALTGDANRNVLSGGPGGDTLHGLAGSDELVGGGGGDTLTGDDGGDTVYGGAGQDSVHGGAGDDSLRVRDSEADTVACGADDDLVLADPIDALDGCEGADTGARVSGGGGGTTTPPPAAPAADTTRPRVTIRALTRKQLKRKAFLKGLPLSIGCDEACGLDVELRGSARSVRLARYEVTIAQRSLGQAPAGTRKLTLKPSRKLVGKAKRLTVQLRVTATDAAGNRTTATRVLKVR